MKKVLAILLCMIMAVGMAMPAFAADASNPEAPDTNNRHVMNLEELYHEFFEIIRQIILKIIDPMVRALRDAFNSTPQEPSAPQPAVFA